VAKERVRVPDVGHRLLDLAGGDERALGDFDLPPPEQLAPGSWPRIAKTAVSAIGDGPPTRQEPREGTEDFQSRVRSEADSAERPGLA
jgi:hypothetical protein